MNVCNYDTDDDNSGDDNEGRDVCDGDDDID